MSAAKEIREYEVANEEGKPTSKANYIYSLAIVQDKVK